MIKILLYSNGMCSLYVSLQKWLLSRKPKIILLSYEIGLINDNDFLYPSYIFRTQIYLLELDRTGCKYKLWYKKARFNTDRLFVQRLRDKPENAKLSIIIKNILNSNKQL